MTDIRVQGGKRLSGEIFPSTNKNAVLPVLCASLLNGQPLTLHRVPDITDVQKLLDYFRALGSTVEWDETGTLKLHHHENISQKDAELPSGMRSSIMLIPALLHRFGEVMIQTETKGCTLGTREVDPHMELFATFGAKVERLPAGIHITLPNGFTAAQHWMDYASVTTTENFVMCAALAGGPAGENSSLNNAASEPHVQEFCQFMQACGANIEGCGTSNLNVSGVETLNGTEMTFVEDFHEITTFLAIGAMTGGDVRVKNSNPENFPLIDRTFAKFGIDIEHEGGWSRAVVKGGQLKVQPTFTPNVLAKIEAAPWPYLPVDLLPIFVALGVKAEGSLMYWNKVYEGAMGWTTELSKLGGHTVMCDPHRVITFGGKPLVAGTVESPYIIRVALALFMVAASIEGESTIKNADPIRRAHPNFVENLNALGAQVTWLD